MFSTIASIAAFAVDDADVKRVVDEIFVFRNDDVMKYQAHDLYGEYGTKEYYSAGEQRTHATAELKSQAAREVMLKIRTRKQSEVYFAETSDLPLWRVSKKEAEACRRASAQYHAYTHPEAWVRW